MLHLFQLFQKERQARNSWRWYTLKIIQESKLDHSIQKVSGALFVLYA